MLSKALCRGGIALAAALAAAACSSGIGQPSDAAGSGQDVRVIPVAQRQQAPDLSGTTLSGTRLSLASYRGKVVVLNIWGSWCAPCRAEAPNLEAVYQQTQAQGVAFVGIDTQDQTAQAQAFLTDEKVTYPSLVDSNGQLQLEFDKTVPPSAVPVTMVIDRQGRIAVVFTGGITASELNYYLAPVIAEPPTGGQPSPKATT